MITVRSTSRLPLLMLLIASSCREARDPGLARGTTVVMAVPDVRAIRPDEWDLEFLIFLPLALPNQRGELEGRLARSWEHSADFKEWTYHLRTDLRWHDGKAVTARDVKFTLDLLAHPAISTYRGYNATIIDDSTVRIRAAKPNYLDDIVYYPEHLLASLDPHKFEEWDFWTRPVGNGPFRFVRYLPGRLIEFEANPGHYKGKPQIQRLILKFVGGAALTELLSGGVDLAAVEHAQVPRVANDPRFRIYRTTSSNAASLYWKVDHPLFRDTRVRRALTHAIDRRELLSVMNLPSDVLVTDAVFTPRQFRRREWPEPLPYDSARARTLLAAAGWVDRDNDGILDKDGHPFRFTASVARKFGLEKVAIYVQAQLRRVGVQMDIQLFDESIMWDKRRTGDFEAWMFVNRSVSYFGKGNPVGYANAEAFELIDRLRTTAHPDEEDEIYRGISKVFLNDPPMVRLLTHSSTSFVHRRIHGQRTGFRPSLDGYMDELWVEK